MKISFNEGCFQLIVYSIGLVFVGPSPHLDVKLPTLSGTMGGARRHYRIQRKRKDVKVELQLTALFSTHLSLSLSVSGCTLLNKLYKLLGLYPLRIHPHNNGIFSISNSNSAWRAVPAYFSFSRKAQNHFYCWFSFVDISPKYG